MRSAHSHPHKILVIDDEPGIRASCRKVLESEGFETVTAENGIQGYELFRQHKDFAAALVDLKMPGLGGMELIEKMRADDGDVVLLVITAYAAIETAVEAAKRGAYGYIPKPFTPEELLLHVKNGLENRALKIEARQLREEREASLLEVAYERSKASTIIACMADGVIVVNREAKVVLRNAAAGKLLSWREGDHLPCALGSVPCTGLQDMLQQAASAAGAEIVSRELAIDNKAFLVNASPLRDSAGTLLGGLAVLRDITSVKELAAAKSRFISMVAHELKSPLAAIESYINVILSGHADPASEQGRTMLERSLLRSRTARRLVEELLSLRAMEAGHFALSRTTASLGEICKKAADACSARASEKNISLTLELESVQQPQVLIDTDAMSTVFINLIDNAVKYTPPGGSVCISSRCSKTHISISVSDTGIGISDEDKEKIFDEFYRVRNKHTSGIPGTGLGLSLVKHLVDMHNALISVHSTPGSGSTFTVSIPIAAT